METGRPCHNHPDRNSASLCHACQEFFCTACLVEGKTYYYCTHDVCRQRMKEDGEALPENEEFPSTQASTHIKLVTVAVYSHPYQADLAKAFLLSEGIPAFVADEHL